LAFSYWFDKPWFLTEGKTCYYIHHTFLLGFPNWPVIYFIITAPSIAIKAQRTLSQKLGCFAIFLDKFEFLKVHLEETSAESEGYMT
jgi:hypothetical protein